MVYFILNPMAQTGHAKDIWKDMAARLEWRGVSYQLFETEYKGHARYIASDICDIAATEGGRHLMIVMGGDGTFNEVFNGMHDYDCIDVGLIPMGSGNDLCRGLGIEVDQPLVQMDHILDAYDAMIEAGKQSPELLDARIQKMDLGEVCLANGPHRKFGISAGIGVDAMVCKQADGSRLKKFLNFFGLGSLVYVLLTVKNIFTMPVADGSLLVKNEDGSKSVKKFHSIIFCAAMNQKYEGGGVPMAPDGDAFDGLLSVCAVHDIPRGLCFIFLPILLAQKHAGLKGFDLIDCESMQIKLKQPMIVHADGEYVGETDHLLYRVIPSCIRIVT